MLKVRTHFISIFCVSGMFVFHHKVACYCFHFHVCLYLLLFIYVSVLGMPSIVNEASPEVIAAVAWVEAHDQGFHDVSSMKLQEPRSDIKHRELNLHHVDELVRSFQTSVSVNPDIKVIIRSEEKPPSLVILLFWRSTSWRCLPAGIAHLLSSSCV
jgi:hypothetical protein